MNGGLMELEEALSWIELIGDDHIKPLEQLLPLIEETNTLIAIFVSQINKWKPR